MESKSSFSFGTILTLIGLFITIVFNILTYISTKDQERFNERKNQAELENSYADYIANLEKDCNEIAWNHHLTDDVLAIHNYTKRNIFFCIGYMTLNRHWIARGHINLAANGTSNIDNMTNENVYIYCASYPHYLNNKLVDTTGVNTFLIRKKHVFTIDDEKAPPFRDTIRKKFAPAVVNNNKDLYLSDTLIKFNNN